MPHQHVTRTWVQTYTSGYATIKMHALPLPSSDGRARSSRCCAAQRCWHDLAPLSTCDLPHNIPCCLFYSLAHVCHATAAG